MMSDDLSSSEMSVYGSSYSSDLDSDYSPESDADSNSSSSSESELVETPIHSEDGVSATMSASSQERQLDEIAFSADVSYSITTRRRNHMIDGSHSTVSSSTHSEESNESDAVEIVSETETPAIQPAVSSPISTQPETGSAVVQPGEASSETGSVVVQPGEASSETGSAVVLPGEASSETGSAVVLPGEASSETGSAVVHPGVASSGVVATGVIPSPKRRRIVSPEKKKVPAQNKIGADENPDDEDNCSICFDSWTTSGKHRPASLKCGHLFGHMCIDKWLKGQGEKCPQCNAKAKRSDIRVIFTRNIKAVDTTERDHALEQLAQVQKRNIELMTETAHLGLKYQVAMSERNRLQTELSKAKDEIFVLKRKLNNGNSVISSQFPSTQDLENNTEAGKVDLNSQELGKFVWEKTLTISEGGNCRVMTHSLFLGTIAVSQPSSVSLFPGFGVKKISSLDFKTTEYMTLHSKPIRNLCFHPRHNDGVLLSCSLDKTVKITSMISNTIVQVYNLPIGAWSCIWNSEDYNYFFVGLQNGFVQEYDIRNTESFVRELNIESSRSPVASLQYVPAAPNSHFRPGGLLVGQLNQVSFYEKIPGNEYKTHLLPLEGNVSSLCFNTHTRQMLASFRSSTTHPKVRHMMCEFSMLGDNSSLCSCNTVQTFYGGTTQTLLSRSLLVPHPQNRDHLLVCAGDEASKGVKIWNSNSVKFTQDVSCEGAVVDLCHIDASHHYLLALTDKKLQFHEWRE